MATFTPEEMEFLKIRGNEFCRKVWLARFNPSVHREPDSKDEHKVKEFMSDKYEKKRYYTEPTESLHLEAREMNTPPVKLDTKQLRSLTGNSLPALKVDQNKPVSVPQTISQVKPVTTLAASSQPTTVTVPLPTQQPPQPKPAAFDLLGDLGGDPFAGPANKPVETAPAATKGFADFSAFSSPGITSPPQTTPTFPTGGGGLLQPMNTASQSVSSVAAPNGLPSGLSTSTQSSTVTSSVSDKYAALASLDSALGGGGTNPSVNWDGAPPGSGGIWNSGGSSGVFGSGTSNTGSGGVATNSAPGFGGATSSSASNPFGATQAPFGTSPQNAAVTPGGNPFMAGGFGQFPATASTGFAPFPAATVAPVSAVAGQPFGVQNGGFGTTVAPSQAGFAMPGFATAPGQFPAQAAVMPSAGGQFVTKMGPTAVAPPGGQTQQQFGSWGQTAAGNPFMAPAPPQPVPPRGSSTNPFL